MINVRQYPHPVRMNKDGKTYEYAIVVAMILILFNFYPASVVGLAWLWVSAGVTMLFTLCHALELRWPGPRLQFIVQAPILFVGPLMYLSVVLTLWAGDRLHGLWLALLVLGGLHIVVMNALTIRYADNGSIIATMVRTKLITKHDEGTYFSLPYRIGKAANLPNWLYRLVWGGRCFWISVIVFGAIFFAPGVYSSVDIENRLLNVMGTLSLGFAVLFARLWQVPLFRRIQREFV